MAAIALAPMTPTPGTVASNRLEPVGAMPLPQPRLNLTDLGLRILRCAMMSRKIDRANSGKPALFCSITATNRSTWRKPWGDPLLGNAQL